MKNFTFLACLMLITTGVSYSQSSNASAGASGKSGSNAEVMGRSASVDGEFQIVGELQKSLDVKKAKVGDEVLLKTKNAVKNNGETVAKKGSTLIGRVTEVKRDAKESAGSKIGILFDRLKDGNRTMPISATIVSVTNVAARTAVNDDVFSGTSAGSSTRAGATPSGSRNSAGGGLLGGVVGTTTSTVGNVAGTATDTVGGVVDSTGGTLNGVTGTTGGLVRGLSISQSADGSASGSSTLSLSKGDLKLQKGATFTLDVSQSANVSGR